MFKRLIIVALLILTVSAAPGVFTAFKAAATFKESGQGLDNIGSSLIDQLNQNLAKQEELRRKIADAQTQEKNLSNEIAYLNNQIALTTLQIEESETRLSQLSGDIQKVTGQLESTKQDLDYTQTLADTRVRTMYKQSFVGPLDEFLGSSSFNDFLVHQKYTQVIRTQDLELLKSLQSLKQDYSNQKADLEDKKNKEQALKADLDQKNKDLAAQQGSKQYILGVTKNNEKNYQGLLAQVQSELASIARALGGGVKLGPVRRGDVIAFQGNTGCSTGSHLHFGLYINGGAVNPMPHLNSGALHWPENSPTITQGFGDNYWWYWSNFRQPGHNGIDMTAGYGAPIYAAMDGVAYLTTDGGCPGIPGITGTVPGKWIRIEHYNGWATLYGHIR